MVWQVPADFNVGWWLVCLIESKLPQPDTGSKSRVCLAGIDSPHRAKMNT